MTVQTNKTKEQMPKDKPNVLWTVIRITLILFIISVIFAGCLSLILIDESKVDLSDKNVVLIRVNGPITLSADNTLFSSQESSQDILNYIKTANDNSNIKAIIFEINSPGGTVVASKELVDAIKKVNKTTVAWVREIGTSGAYWSASATNHIIADDLSAVGSIGVIGSYVSFDKWMTKYNITYNQLIAGEYKDMGTPLKELTSDERDIMQKKLNLIHDYFIRDVAANRNMTYDEVKKLATGEYYLGIEAKKNGLVDELGDFDTVNNYLVKKLNTTIIKIAVFEKPKTFFERLNQMSSKTGYFVGRGIGDSFKIEESSEIPQLR